jgi:hypothetical protein
MVQLAFLIKAPHRSVEDDGVVCSGPDAALRRSTAVSQSQGGSCELLELEAGSKFN